MPLAFLLALLACLSACGRGGSDSNVPEDPPVQPTISTGPYLQAPGATAMTIMWETSGPVTGRLQYGPTPEYAYRYDEPQAVVIHQIRLTGLAPETRYHFRVLAPSDAAQPDERTGTFVTAPESTNPFTFVVYGDSRADPVVHHALADKVLEAAPAFFVHVGDFVSNGNDTSLWEDDFFTPAAALLRATPLLPVLGNHENNARSYYDFFAPPAAESGSTTEAWYSCNYGCAHLIVLDSQQDFSPRSAQYAWLLADLASQNAAGAAWRIVALHDPVYSSALHGGNADVQKYLVPAFESYRVNLVLSGHDHAYVRSLSNGITYIVTGGGGAGLYPVNSTPNPHQVYAASAFHFVLLTVSEARIDGEARDIAGTPFETFSIDPR